MRSSTSARRLAAADVEHGAYLSHDNPPRMVEVLDAGGAPPVAMLEDVVTEDRFQLRVLHLIEQGWRLVRPSA